MAQTTRLAVAKALAHVVRQVGSRYGLYQQALADAVDMHPSDIAALLAIEAAGSLTAGELADALGLTSGAVTGLVDRLVRAGAVRRSPDPHDRRRVLITAVDEASDATEFSARLADDLAARLGTRDPQEALRVLEAVQEALSTQIDALRGGAGPEASLDDLTLSAPRGEVSRARFELSPSTAAVVFDALAEEADLFRAQFTRDRPSVSVSDGAVVMRFAARPVEGRLAVISLAPDASWSLRIRGGEAKVRADLSGLIVRRLTVMGGRNDVDVRLPPTTSRAPVRITAGHGRINLRIPESAPAQIVWRGIGNNVMVKDKRIVAVSGHRYESADFDEGKPGYTVSMFGGTNQLTVMRAT